jgi:PKD repeat protein
MKCLLNILLFTICIYTVSNAQTSVIGGIINKYARVTVLDTCVMSVSVAEPSLFPVGSKVLLIQMSGATMQARNNESFGTLESLKNTGKYEINQVDSIAGNTIYLRYKFLNVYLDPSQSGITQLITFPSYDNAVVNDTLRARPWNGETGGVIAFEANSVTLNMPIIASATGFRGGGIKSYNECNPASTYSDYYYDLNSSTNDNGGIKGESIVPYLGGRECGRGSQMTGGGGGNNHKSGGGGGAHLNFGGNGGESIRGTIFRCQGVNPGIGGRSLPITIGSDYLFFGGGGGSGHNKEGSDTRGGNGGGIVIIKANTLEGNNRSILANGSGAAFNSGDGAGGGGAGGTITLLVKQITGSLTLEAKGGNGGNSTSTPNYDFGPGGGGSGGRVLLTNSTSSISINLTGGTAGKNITTQSNQTGSNGGIGVSSINTALALPIASQNVTRKLKITTQPLATLVCEGDSTLLTIAAVGPSVRYQWQINKGDGMYNPLSNNELYEGVQTSALRINKPTSGLNPFLYRCMVISNCSKTDSVASTSISLIIKAPPIPIFTYVINNNKVAFTNGSSNGLSFKWSFGDGAVDTGRSPVYTYALQDTYRVKLIVGNECGTDSYSTIVNLNTPPFAAFTANGADACPPSTVSFLNSSSDNVRKFYWFFPGGTPDTSTQKNPSIRYNTIGLYDVKLVVENGFGRDTFIRKGYVKINDIPKVNFSVNKNGLDVSFLNSTTSATSYLWKFGDGNTSSQASPQYRYRFAGTYIVTLTAKNACGAKTDSVTLSVYALPAATVIASQLQGCSPLSVQFSGRNTTSVSTWNWSFPGGTPSSSNLANPRVSYKEPGSYDVILTMTNSVGSSTIRQDTFIKVSLSPKVSFNTKISDSIVECFNTSLDASVYKWNFGDGSKEYVGSSPPPHLYDKNGIYTIRLLGEKEYCAFAVEKQVSIFSYTASKELNTEGGVTLYPNPTNGKLYLEFKESFIDDFQLQVSDMQGKILKNLKLDKVSLQELEMEDLAKGVYFFYFSNEKYHFVKKIAKM